MRYDYQRIARDFLRALRGRRSQAAFSRRLGYRTNVAYTWESGRAFPTAATVLNAAVRSGVDVHAAVFLEVNKPKPVVLFELAKGWLTGERVEPGETHELTTPHRRS